MSSVLRALLVDDERLARKRLRELLLAHPGIRVVGEADGVNAAAELAAQEQPDVIFLDVQMPPHTGFDLLPRLSPVPQVVFVTAYDAFAVRAFEAQALDYLLKPVHPDRLAETVRRLRTEGGAKPGAPAEEGALQIKDLIALRDRGHMRMVTVDRIAAIAAEGAYTQVILSGQGSMLILKAIGHWESRLPFPPFVRVERSLLVNLNLVREVHVRTRDHTEVNLDGVAQPLVLGRPASARLRKAMKV